MTYLSADRMLRIELHTACRQMSDTYSCLHIYTYVYIYIYDIYIIYICPAEKRIARACGHANPSEKLFSHLAEYGKLWLKTKSQIHS